MVDKVHMPPSSCGKIGLTEEGTTSWKGVGFVVAAVVVVGEE